MTAHTATTLTLTTVMLYLIVVPSQRYADHALRSDRQRAAVPEPRAL
jgi:hypothetical protein